MVNSRNSIWCVFADSGHKKSTFPLASVAIDVNIGVPRGSDGGIPYQESRKDIIGQLKNV